MSLACSASACPTVSARARARREIDLRLIAGILLVLGAVPFAFADGTPARRTLTPDDFYRVQDVSEPQVSPDGLWVAYVVTTNDRESDEARSAVWMVSWDGSQRLALTAAAEGTDKPKWSPDGRYLSFLSIPAGSDKAQIMLLDRRGGDARQLTGVSGDIGEYAWSPDGKRLVFALESGDTGSQTKPMVIDALHFKQDEDGYLTQDRVRHLYSFEIEGKHLEQLTADAGFNEDIPVWSPDGCQIAFVRTHELGADQDGREDIDVMDAAAGAAVRKIARPYAPNNQRLAWSPDGKHIAYLEGLEPKLNAYMQDHLVLVPVAGGTPRPLTEKLDRAVMSYAFSPDSASVTIAVEDDGTIYPARADLSGGSVTREVAANAAVVSAISSGRSRWTA
jgi:Tol biopolymer transport system component